ncbi:MAG: hypothetical protein M3460_16330 [Actinomycetota bacterium]|nr:hypothetical protein [Actinomycetota bacterium]
MTTGAQRSRAVEARSSGAGVVEEGAERYIWVFPEGDQLVLAIPGLRGLKFNIDEARSVGEMLIQTTDEMTERQRKSGDEHGGTENAEVEG